jgi:hypothetical protein
MLNQTVAQRVNVLNALAVPWFRPSNLKGPVFLQGLDSLRTDYEPEE